MGKKILLADDSITIQKVIELTFSDEDFDVVTVGNGRLAIEKVQEVRPDVVLCDIIMPEKDGYEVCDFIKKTPTLAQIPVLLLTGAFEPFDQDRANRVGCDGYLAKPFEPETLIAKVRDLLNRAAKPAQSTPRPPSPVGERTAVAQSGAPSAAIPFVAPAREPEPFAPRQAGFLTSPPPRPAEPIPFPRAASATPTPASFAPVHPPAPPQASEPIPVASFIPDEPFEDLDAGSLTGEDTPAGAPVPPAFPAGREELLPMTPEESRSLSAPPEDSSSTVMFRAESLPWNAGAPAAAPPAPSSAATTTAPPTMPMTPEPLPEAEPEVAELPVFEEVIEEEVEFTPVPPAATPVMEVFAPEPPPPPPPLYSPPAYSAPVYTPPPPPAPPPPPPVVSHVVAPPPVPPPPVVAPEPPPPVYVAPPPPPPPPTYVAERAAMPAPPPEPEPSPVEEIEELTPPLQEASFEDLAVGEPAPVPAAAEPSQAAEVSVPMDMVEKIAQRVVAQISEKVVREIAWEVIPDLAEAMIRAEIERLKGELQRL
jgi:CheY-like chemotaxis protein